LNMHTGSSATNETCQSPWPRRAALAAALLTVPILLIGGTVTTLRVGMAVPDWPTTFEQNMFTYPLSEMLRDMGVFWEHSHRLWGALVGFAVLCTCVLTLVYERSVRLRWLSVVALLAVSAQGVLGGLRVLENSQHLAFLHGTFAQGLFTLFCAQALLHSTSWRLALPRASAQVAFLNKWGLVTSVAIYVQIALGAWTRHNGGMHALFAHMGLALLVTGLVVVLGAGCGKVADEGGADAPRWRALKRRLHLLLGVQVLLGILAAVWVYLVTGPHNPVSVGEAVFATLHVAVGALLLWSTVSCWLWTRRTLRAH
jgi:cytochrome c oxidase assembly protein subunit 15